MNNVFPSSRLLLLDVELDTANARLLRRGEEQHLRQKAFEVLLYLIEHRDRTVAKEEILDAVWSGSTVSEDALVQCIVDIRKALGDEARESRFVRTVLKRGYRFVAPVQPLPQVISSMTVEVETSRSVQIELVQDGAPPTGDRSIHWRSAAMVALLAVTAASLGALTFSTLRPEMTQRAAPLPVDAITSNSEAYRLYALGLERAEAYRGREAVALFEKALALDREFAMAHARIAYVHGVIGSDIAAARPHLQRALQLPERLSERERMLVSAWQATVETDFPTAIERYRIIVDRYPTDMEAHRSLARLLSGEERVDEAIAVLEHARTIDPNDANIDNALGIYSLVGRHDESIAARLRYIEKYPHEPNAWDSLGGSYHGAGRYDQALKAYGRALELRPDFDLARYHRAATYVQQGRFRDAILDLEDCLARATTDEDLARTWTTLADVFRVMGDSARAVDAASRVPAGTAWQPSLVHVDQGLIDDGDLTDRGEVTRSSSGRGSRPERRFEFVLRGRVALRQGENDQAIQFFRRALKFRAPTWYVETYETCLADAYLHLAKYDDAAREYERILSNNSRDAFALYGLGRAYEGSGRGADARAAYHRFIDSWKEADPDARHLIDVRKRMARL